MSWDNLAGEMPGPHVSRAKPDVATSVNQRRSRHAGGKNPPADERRGRGQGCRRHPPRRCQDRQCLAPNVGSTRIRRRIGRPFTRSALVRIITERLREHPVQAQFLGLTKLFSAECHGLVTRFGPGAICAEEPVPQREIKAEVAVRLAPNNGMMYAVHVRCDDQPAQQAFDGRR